MKPSDVDQRRLLRAIRLAHQIRANLLREIGPVMETGPKQGGPSARKKRVFSVH